jgi:hypothetical protein
LIRGDALGREAAHPQESDGGARRRIRDVDHENAGI